MASDRTNFTLRTERTTLKKMHYIAKYNGRSGNKELEQMLRRYIEAFEKKHGEIKPEDMED